jgi:polygalacturonase
LDIDSSRGVRIANCSFDVGDDCLVIKSGMDEDGVRVGRPTEYVTVTNCTMLRGHGGVVFGSECAQRGRAETIRMTSRGPRGQKRL